MHLNGPKEKSLALIANVNRLKVQRQYYLSRTWSLDEVWRTAKIILLPDFIKFGR